MKVERFKIYTLHYEENDIGGHTEVEKFECEVKGVLVPTRTELRIQDGRVTTKLTTKIYVKNAKKIPKHADFIVHKGVKYKVINHIDIKKSILFEVEIVND